VVEVEDDGAGIEPDHLERIFDPFFTTKDVGKGTGLGLSVTYVIVTRHGGTITVKSEPGRGTCFRVELPGRMSDANDGETDAAAS
jgi:signal transduction histidine kinase